MPDELRDIEAAASIEAERHRPDEQRGGCTCGFCAWSVEHVGIMALRIAVEPLLSALAAEKAAHIETLTREAEAARNANRMRDDIEAERNAWRDTAYAAKGHYEQSDERLARIDKVCADAETMQWADVSRAYGEGVAAAISWVRAALSLSVPTSPQTDEQSNSGEANV